jgi:D-3-phosphoglycerate dehydrogenase
LKIVGRAGTGVDNIDLQAATDHGVLVVNTPGGNTVSVAELTLGAMIACARHLSRADRLLKAGEWAKKKLKGRELNGKTLGLIGLGRIGREVARRARPFGMQVVGFDPYATAEGLAELGIEVVELEALLARAHVISLHVPRTDETAHIIDAAAIARMRPGVILLNFARGGLIDEPALLAALQSGQVSAASLDAFESEPEPLPALVQHDNVLATPHIGASTQEAQENVGYYVAGTVADFLVRGVLQNAVNYPSVSREQMQALAPHLVVAERLGALAGQLADGRVNGLQVTYSGELIGQKVALLTDRVLCGALRPVLDQTDVNPVNARPLAKARGIQIVEATSTDTGGYPAMIRAELTSDRGTLAVAGAAVGKDRPPRLVRIGRVAIDAPLVGPTLYFENDDKPGVIGRVGTYAGEQGINIANFALRADGKGGALGVIQIDQRVSRAQREGLARLPGIRKVRMVDLP